MIFVWSLVAGASYYLAGSDGLVLFGSLFVSLLFFCVAKDLKEGLL